LSIPFEDVMPPMERPNSKPDAALRKRLDFLLAELCTGWGFCSRLTADDLLSEGEALSARKFAEAVLRAEGMNVELEASWRRRIEALFIARFDGWVWIPAFAGTTNSDNAQMQHEIAPSRHRNPARTLHNFPSPSCADRPFPGFRSAPNHRMLFSGST
jgi:hypothetical protein